MKKKHHNSTRRSISSRDPNKKDKTQEKPRIEVSAGGLAYKRTRKGVFFAMVKDSYGKWTFPKGHVKRGESYSDAAIREVMEETGLKDLRVVTELDSIDIWFRDRFVYKGKLIHKFIHYYLFEVPPTTRLKRPKIKKFGEKIRDVAWVPLRDISNRSSYKDMKVIIKQAQKYLDQKKISRRA